METFVGAQLQIDPPEGTASASERLPSVKWAVSLLVIVGIALRMRAYLANRSLWLDEAMLAINVVKRSFSALLLPLDFHQAAPVGFLWLEKLAAVSFGPGEMSLRLVPLLASIGSLPLFYALARRMLGARTALIALGLFAIARPFSYFASEVKPYSTDVFFTIIVLLASVRIVQDRAPNHRPGLTLLAIVGVLSTWFSYPAIFVLLGAGTVLLAYFVRRETRRAWGIACIGVASLVSFAINYWLFIRPTSLDPWLIAYWQNSFLPFPAPSVSVFQSYVMSFYEMFGDALGQPVAGLAAAAFLLGAITLLALSHARPFLGIVLTPLVFLLIASVMQKYPFDARLTLFIVPVLLLLVSSGIASVWSHRIRGVPTGMVLLLVLGSVVTFKALYAFRFPGQREEIRPVLAYAAGRVLPSDVVYLYEGAQRAFEYYSLVSVDDYVPKCETLIYGKRFQNDWIKYQNDLEPLRGHARVWVIFSHVHDWSELNEERLLVHWLNAMGQQRDVCKAAGASAYLYDLSQTGQQGEVAEILPGPATGPLP